MNEADYGEICAENDVKIDAQAFVARCLVEVPWMRPALQEELKHVELGESGGG